MTTYTRIVVAVLCSLAACKGAEDARAKPVPSASAPATSTPPAAAANAATSTDKPAPDPLVAHADSARIRGSASAKVWMILASDFQCPYCKMWHDTTDLTIRREYIDNGKVRLAFVNMPLNIHPNAVPAAEYAMCAAAQDKFWEMHDALFAAQEKWAGLSNAGPVLDQVAGSVGVDMTALRACVSSHRMRPLIEADRDRAVQAGARATPSFFIGTQALEGVQPASELRKVLDAAIAAAK